MDPVSIAVLLTGVFFLAFGITAYRYFYVVIGVTGGLVAAVWARKPMLTLPGLSDRPGVAGILIIVLFILLGIFLATRLRKLLAFLSGLGTGAFLYKVAAAIWTGGNIVQALTGPIKPGAMELLAGTVFGILFLLYEFIFALVLTSAVGAALCTWALGGRWTFVASLAIGLVAQPLISNRLVPEGVGGRPGTDDRTKTGRRTRLLILAMLLIPVSSTWADLVVHHVSLQSGKVVLDVGKTNGVMRGEKWAILDDSGDLIETVVVSEVFADTSYTRSLPSGRLDRIKGGMRIVPFETYEYNKARETESEARLFLQARKTDRVYAYQEFLAQYPRSSLAPEARERIQEFVGWADELEFGKKKIVAIRFFGEYGDETAVPLLVGKLLLPELGKEARNAIGMIGDSAVIALLEVLLSPLQDPALKDRVALILADIGNMTAMPGLRSYVKAKNTRSGREALVKLEQKLGR